MSNETQQHQWFEALWADREDRIYRNFFGNLGPGIYTLTDETFRQVGRKDPDPRWLFHGVFECPPTESRPHWMYVSSGMSNPWGETPESVKPEGYSGLGCEFTMHTDKPGRWALELMQWLMAVQLLVAVGELKGGLVEYDDRIKFRSTSTNNSGDMTRLLITPPPPPGDVGGYPSQFQMVSGKVDLLLMLTISEREAEFARTQNPDALLTLLRHHEVYPLSSLSRQSSI